MSYSFNSSKHFPNLLLTERSLNILGSNLDKLGLPRPGYGFFQALRLFQTNENKTTSISYLSNDVVVFFFFWVACLSWILLGFGILKLQIQVMKSTYAKTKLLLTQSWKIKKLTSSYLPHGLTLFFYFQVINYRLENKKFIFKLLTRWVNFYFFFTSEILIQNLKIKSFTSSNQLQVQI